jgi:hypothetical protein
MNPIKPVDFLKAEIGSLHEILASLSPNNLIERYSFEARLKVVQARLVACQNMSEPKRFPVSFRGAPVEGTRSIDAAFAGSAIKSLVDAIDTVHAGMTTQQLKDRGPLPSSKKTPFKTPLRIVDTNVGSFGFELELSNDGDENHAYEQAIKTTFQLVSNAANQDFDRVTDLVAEVHKRAVSKIRAFVKIVDDAQALVASEFSGQSLKLESPEQLQHVLRVLQDEDIDENIETIKGTLIGVLPDARRFEIKLEDGAVITGKVDRAVGDMVQFKELYENRLSVFEVQMVRVKQSKRYTLQSATL